MIKDEYREELAKLYDKALAVEDIGLALSILKEREQVERAGDERGR